jgi:hypothetical protein
MAGPLGGVGEVTMRILTPLISLLFLSVQASASDLGGACMFTGFNLPDGAQQSSCLVSQDLEWTCDGEPVPRGSSREKFLTLLCWPCAERFPTSDAPCQGQSVVQYLDPERQSSIEYCLKPSCLQLIAPPTREQSE